MIQKSVNLFFYLFNATGKVMSFFQEERIRARIEWFGGKQCMIPVFVAFVVIQVLLAVFLGN